jgi:HK97 family phage portal protein
VNGHAVIGMSVISPEVALRNSDIYSCVMLISSDLASAEFRMKTGKNDNLIRLLQFNPNQLTNSFAFWQTVIQDLLLNGNAYCLIYRNGNAPYKLEYIPTYDVEVNLTDDGQTLFYNIRFDRDKRSDMVAASDSVLHFKLLSRDGIIGISPLHSLIPELNLQKSTYKTILNVVQHGIRPSGVLQIEKGSRIDKKARDHIRNQFEQANSGENVGRVMITDNLTTFTPTQLDSGAMDVLKQTDWTRKQIAKAFGIPTNYLNQEAEHSNQLQVQGLYSTCLNRYVNAIVSEINYKLANKGEEVTLDTSNVVDPDNLMLLNGLSTAVHWGMYSADQAQKIMKEKGAD